MAAEDRCRFDWDPGIAGDHPRAFHRVEDRQIGCVWLEDRSCSLAEGGCDQVVGDELPKSGVVVADLLVVWDTASTCGLEGRGRGQHNQLERGEGVLVEEVEQEQEVGTGIVGEGPVVAELEEGAGQSAEFAVVVVAAAAARQGHNHS
jgi:hypothetical protein